MKKVPALLQSPPLLAQYLPTHPGDAQATGKAAGEAWSRFTNDAAYRELRDVLVERQQGLCLYCEQRLTTKDGALHQLDQQVEHVLPKSKAPGRVLDWRNLALCCGGGTFAHHTDPSRYARSVRRGASNVSCGQHKADDDLPGGLDPRRWAGQPRVVTVDLEGFMAADGAACAQLGVVEDELNALIDFLNLNCERLRLARQEARADVAAWYCLLIDEMLNGTHLSLTQQEAFLSLAVAGRLQPDRHGHLRAWWSTLREALGAPAERWITANLTTLHF